MPASRRTLEELDATDTFRNPIAQERERLSLKVTIMFSSKMKRRICLLLSIPVLLLGLVLSLNAEASGKTFLVDQFGASHSTATITCSGAIGTRLLRCGGGTADFKAGQGVMIHGAGSAPAVSAVRQPPALTPSTKPGDRNYTYVVVAADLLHGMAQASPPASVARSATLDGASRINLKTAQSKGPLPIYLWYVSENRGPYRFVLADQHAVPGTPDAGQRPADGRGWPPVLPHLPVNEDLWTTATAVGGDQLQIADPLHQTVAQVGVYHDDTMAAQAAVDAAERTGGGTIQFGPYPYNLRRPAFWNGDEWSRSITNAKSVYPPKIYTKGRGNLYFEGAGLKTRLINSPDAYTASAMVSFGTERKRPWELPFVHIRPVQRGGKTIELSNPADLRRFHQGDDIWLFSGSYTQSSCPALRGTPGGNCHYSELNTVVKLNPPKTLSLQYSTVNTYHPDENNAFGVVNIAAYAIHNIGFRNLSIIAYGPISTEALTFGFRFDDVQVPVGPATNWWYGGLNRDWVVTNSTLNIGDGGMYFSVFNEMDQYADVRFENDTLVGHSASQGADRMLAYAALEFTEGSGNVLLQRNHFMGVHIRVDNAFNGFTIANNDFENAGINIGCDESSHGCVLAISSFGLSSDVNILGNRFRLVFPFSPPRVLEVRNPATNVRIANNVIDALATNTQASLIYTAAGVVTGNRIISDSTMMYNPVGIRIAPKVINGLAQPDIMVNHNRIEHRGRGVGILVDDPKTSYHGKVVISNNDIAVSRGAPSIISKPTLNNLKNLRSDLH